MSYKSNKKNPYDMKRLRKYSKEKFSNSKNNFMKENFTKNKSDNSTSKLSNRKTVSFSDSDSDSDVSSDGSIITVVSDSVKNKKISSNKKIYSVDEIKNQLSNYIRMPRKDWRNIDNKEHIRFFYKKDEDIDFTIEDYIDNYDRGGFIQFRRKNATQDGAYKWLFGISWSYDYNKNNIRIIEFDKIKSLYKKRDKKVKPEINEFKNKIRDYQKITTGNQVNLQEQINNLYNNIENFREELTDKMSSFKVEIEKNRNSLENLVEFIREKTEKMENRYK